MTEAQRIPDSNAERGNVVFIILLAVVLIGLLTAAIQSMNNSSGSDIDDETIAIRASEVQRSAAEFERGVKFILQNNGQSETDLSFAHASAPADYGAAGTNPVAELFHPDGGGAAYRMPPSGINDGSPWEFFGGTAAPGAGTSAADLIAVLPNVTEAFCQKINALNNQSAQPRDTGAGASSGTTNAGDCVFMTSAGRFGDGSGDQFYATPNTMDETTFAQDASTSAAHPALQACVRCDIGPAYHFYHVLLAR